jgi:hypothetical protein
VADATITRIIAGGAVVIVEAQGAGQAAIIVVLIAAILLAACACVVEWQNNYMQMNPVQKSRGITVGLSFWREIGFVSVALFRYVHYFNC